MIHFLMLPVFKGEDDLSFCQNSNQYVMEIFQGQGK